MKNLLLVTILFACVAMISSCKSDGKKDATAKIETAVADKSKDIQASTGETYNVDPKSTINWTGVKPTGKHMGTINVSSGKLLVAKGTVVGGNFDIDMNTISCTDLEGDAKSDLEAHLKGTAKGKEDHFFNVAKFPTASYKITKVTSLVNDPAATHLVYGTLNMKGVDKEVGFKAKIESSGNGFKISSPDFTINRTDWGIKFMSKNFMEDIKDKFINDDIILSVNLTAAK